MHVHQVFLYYGLYVLSRNIKSSKHESNFINGGWYWEAWKWCVDTIIQGEGETKEELIGKITTKVFCYIIKDVN